MNQPSVPDLDEYARLVREAFDARWLTNFGKLHEEFRARLAALFGTPWVLPVTNATVGLFAVLRALDVRGEVITVPFTFPATYNVLFNLPGVTPVFVDVSAQDFCMRPDRAREAVTSRTAAIVPVHAYGFPCDVKALEAVAHDAGVPLVYDAAPAVGSVLDGRSLASFGDASVVSFHATKVLSTAEGGAIVCRTEALWERCRRFVNFGIEDEDTVSLPGINGKLDEIRAALGILGLDVLEPALARRRVVTERYLAYLEGARLPGIEAPRSVYRREGFRSNYAYFPVLVRRAGSLGRDGLYSKLREAGIVARKYYYPTVLDSPALASLPARYEDVSSARELSRSVICLPVNPHFSDADCDAIIGKFDALVREMVRG